MNFINNFFNIYTGIFITLCTYSISYEFKIINNKINRIEFQCNNINNELMKLDLNKESKK